MGMQTTQLGMLCRQNTAPHYPQCRWNTQLDENEGAYDNVQSHVEETGGAMTFIAQYNPCMLPAPP